MSSTIKSLLTIKNVASILAVSESTVRRIINDGSLRFYKVRGNIRFKNDDVSDYLNEDCLELIKAK